jgi:hypothetical protein
MPSFIAIVLVDVNIITTYESGFERQASSCIIKLRNCLNKNIDKPYDLSPNITSAPSNVTL